MARTVDEIMRDRRAVSDEGVAVLVRAVGINHDWSLRFSSEDKLIEAVEPMSDDDLEAAYLLVHYLQEAIACVQMRRDMQRGQAEKQ